MKTQTKKRKLVLSKKTVLSLSANNSAAALGGKTSTIPTCVPDSGIPNCRVVNKP